MFADKKIIIISLILGLAAALCFYLYSGGYLTKKQKQINKAEVAQSQNIKCVVAAKDISSRTVLTKDMLTTIDIPANIIPAKTFTGTSAAEGKVTRDRIFKGQIIIEDNLKDGKDNSELAFKLPSGKRAITIGATVTSAVGNMLKPGDLVDLIVYLNSNVAGEDSSFTLLRKMLILATDTSLENNEQGNKTVEKMTGTVQSSHGYQSITIAATPDECVKINLAESIGTLKLVLHSPNYDTSDADKTTAEIVTIRDLEKIVGFKFKTNEKQSQQVAQQAASPAPAPAPAYQAQIVAQPAPAVQKPTNKQSPQTGNTFRTVYIMRGSKISEMNVAANDKSEVAMKRGE